MKQFILFGCYTYFDGIVIDKLQVHVPEKIKKWKSHIIFIIKFILLQRLNWLFVRSIVIILNETHIIKHFPFFFHYFYAKARKLNIINPHIFHSHAIKVKNLFPKQKKKTKLKVKSWNVSFLEGWNRMACHLKFHEATNNSKNYKYIEIKFKTMPPNKSLLDVLLHKK